MFKTKYFVFIKIVQTNQRFTTATGATKSAGRSGRTQFRGFTCADDDEDDVDDSSCDDFDDESLECDEDDDSMFADYAMIYDDG